MKRILFSLFAFAAVALAGGAYAQSGDFGSVRLSEIKKAAASVPSATASDVKAFDSSKVMPMKEWTVMAFMNGKNNVEKFALMDVDEMEEVGSTDKVNMVVELGRLHAGSQRMYIGKKGESQVISKDPNADMGDYRRVIDFIKWAKTNYPARRYMFVFWNHGLGWLDPKMQKDGVGDKGISFDDDTKNYVRTPQLAEIFRQAGSVDVFAANACLMQMAETVYEIKDYAKVMIGSEETMLAYGYDYTSLLTMLNSNPGFSPEQIGYLLVKDWKDFMSIPQLSKVPGTLSTVNAAALGELPEKLDAFAEAVMDKNETDAVKYAIPNVLRFTSLLADKDPKKMLSSYADLYDFTRLIVERASSNEVKEAGHELMDFIQYKLITSYVGINVTAQGEDYARARGIAIEVTKKAKNVSSQFDAILETKYSDLALAKASKWGQFVEWTDNVWNSN